MSSRGKVLRLDIFDWVGLQVISVRTLPSIIMRDKVHRKNPDTLFQYVIEKVSNETFRDHSYQITLSALVFELNSSPGLVYVNGVRSADTEFMCPVRYMHFADEI